LTKANDPELPCEGGPDKFIYFMQLDETGIPAQASLPDTSYTVAREDILDTISWK
jgi:hypothetical protein